MILHPNGREVLRLLPPHQLRANINMSPNLNFMLMTKRDKLVSTLIEACIMIPSESAPSSPEDTDTTRWLRKITRIDQQPDKTVLSNAVNIPTLPPGLIIRDLFREQQQLLDKEPEFGAY